MESIKDILQARNSQTGKQGTPSHHQTQSLKPLLKPIEEAANSLNVNPEHTFENFKRVQGGEIVKRSFIEVIKGPRYMLLVNGGVGNGKTHLLEASAIELYKQGKFCRVMDFASMLTTLRSAINNPDMDYNEILNNYCDSERLIIDDVGAGGSDREFGDKILETIICARYSRNLLTIVSTNKDIESLPERVLSRFKDKSISYLVLNKADDYRPKL